MPVITITMGEATTNQKKQLIEKLTAATVEVTQVPAQYVTVVIHELSLDNLGVGGQTVTAIKAAHQ